MAVDSLHSRFNGVRGSQQLQADSLFRQFRATAEFASVFFPYGWKGAFLGGGFAFAFLKIKHLINPNLLPPRDLESGVVLGGAIGGSINGVPGTVVGMCLGIPAYAIFHFKVVRPLFGR